MKIKLQYGYRGRLSNGQLVPAGEYDADELPKGLAAYLVRTDHATVIEGEVAEPVENAPAEDEGDSSPQGDLPAYTSLTQGEWLAYADERGLTIDATANDSKQAVYDAIVEASGEA